MEYAVVDLNTSHIFEKFEHTQQGLCQAKIYAINYNSVLNPAAVCELSNDVIKVIWTPTQFEGGKIVYEKN